MTRNRKTNQYVEALLDDEKTIIEKYSLKDKLVNERFNINLAKEMNGKDLSMDYIKTSGFKQPLVFRNSDGLDIKMPVDPNFSVNHILKLVGKDKIIPVQKCEDQSTIYLTLGKFCNYFNSKNRKYIYNVLSLEFSNTKLSELVRRPSVINQFDWIDSFFPNELKDELGNKYPKIRKYCLMSVANSFTTFHIDFGGTSVWYHLLKGSKIFWLIEPTAKNLALYEQYYSTKSSTDQFFGDLVDKCQRVTLNAGDTFLMPSGWIHAVYTPEDSIVFGGNFTHSLAVEMQLKISEMEKRLKTPTDQRFPLEINLQWFVIEDLVFTKTGKSFLVDDSKRLKTVHDEKKNYSSIEIDGIKMLLDHLSCYLSESIEGITDVKELWLSAVDILEVKEKYLSLISTLDKELSVASTKTVSINKSTSKRASSDTKLKVKSKKPKTTQSTSNTSTKKRQRCGVCDGCVRDDCKNCKACLDKPKYGGPNLFRKACFQRKCTNLLTQK